MLHVALIYIVLSFCLVDLLFRITWN